MPSPTKMLRSRYFPDEYRQRPRDYDPRLCDEVLERVRNGELLPTICEDRHMPLPGTFLTWCQQEPQLAEDYDAARRIGCDVLFDEVVVAAHHSDPSTARVRADALKFHVERSMPEKYGPRATIRSPKAEDDAGGGLDYAAEVRRKLEAMHSRQAEQTPDAQPPTQT